METTKRLLAAAFAATDVHSRYGMNGIHVAEDGTHVGTCGSILAALKAGGPILEVVNPLEKPVVVARTLLKGDVLKLRGSLRKGHVAHLASEPEALPALHDPQGRCVSTPTQLADNGGCVYERCPRCVLKETTCEVVTTPSGAQVVRRLEAPFPLWRYVLPDMEDYSWELRVQRTDLTALVEVFSGTQGELTDTTWTIYDEGVEVTSNADGTSTALRVTAAIGGVRRPFVGISPVRLDIEKLAQLLQVAKGAGMHELVLYLSGDSTKPAVIRALEEGVSFLGLIMPRRT
jgi:hypothetical protein